MPLKDFLKYKYVIVLSGIGTICAVYGLYRLFNYYREADDYVAKVAWHHGGTSQRRILVSGLNGGGKTRLLQCFQQKIKPDDILPNPSPTIGLNVISVGIYGIDYHFWDMACNGTSYWKQFIKSIDVLLWVVDSSDPLRVYESQTNLHEVMRMIDDHEEDTNKNGEVVMYGIPIVIVAAKQDLHNSLKPSAVLELMKVTGFRARHNIYVVGTRLPSTGTREGLLQLYELISFANKKRFRRPAHAEAGT